MFTIYANLSDLIKLPVGFEYLFFNYKWQYNSELKSDRVELHFSAEETEQASATFHELWKVLRSRISKSWI